MISRFPILRNRRVVLEEIAGKPFYYRAFYLDRLAQVVEIEIEKRPPVIMNIHLEAYDKETRVAQARQVLDIYRSFNDRLPVLIIGDFNCVPPGATRKTGFPDEPETDFLSHNVIKLFMEAEGLREAILDGEGWSSEKATFTFPSDSPNRRLDYIFYTPGKISCLRAFIPKIPSSDHLPVVMEFSFKNQPDG